MTAPGLRRFDVTVYKEKSPTDAARIPAAANVDLYFQGATVSQSTTLYRNNMDPPPPSPQTIPVRDLGTIRAGDTIRIGPTGIELEVVEVDDTPEVLVDYPHNFNTSVPAGTRLIIASRRPTVYQDPAGQVAISPPTITTTSVLGQGNCYVAESLFDYVVSAADISARVYPDARGGSRGGELSWVSPAGFYDLQAAIDACIPGGTVFIPAGDYTVPSGGLTLNKTICLRGEPGTRLFSYSVAASQPIIKLATLGNYLSNVTIRDLTLLNSSRPSSKLAGNYGIACDVPNDGSKVATLVIENVTVANMGDDAVHLVAEGTNDAVFVFVRLLGVQCVLSRASGICLKFANLVSLTDCYMNANDEYGLFADQSELVAINSAFENNCQSSGLNATYGGQAYMRSCPISRFDSCHFENFTTSSQPVNKRGLTIENSPCCAVSSCWFVNPSGSTSTTERGIFCTFGSGAGVMALALLPSRFTNLQTAVEIDSGTNAARDCVVFPQFIEGGAGAMMIPIGVSDSGLAALNVRTAGGSLRGAYLPALQGASFPSDLTSADAGFLLYDVTDNRVRMWDGENWRQLAVV